MQINTLFVGSALSLINATLYFLVGHSLLRRPVRAADARLAWILFVVWWYALAGSTAISGLQTLLAALGVNDLPLFVSLTQMNILSICAGLCGLLYYLLYIFSGSRKWLASLTAAYIAYYALLVYFIQWRKPVGIAIDNWTASIKYEQPASGIFFMTVLLLLILPQILGGLAYFSLFFKMTERTQRYRIALVSWSIIIWFSSSLLASFSGFAQEDWWQLTSRLIGTGAAFTVLMAYYPFKWIKDLLKVESISDEVNI